MPDKPGEKKKGGRTGVLVATLAIGLVLLPVLYVGSSGPTWAMVRRGQVDFRTYETLYSPLSWVTNVAVVNWWAAYLGWWDEHWPGEPLKPPRPAPILLKPRLLESTPRE